MPWPRRAENVLRAIPTLRWRPTVRQHVAAFDLRGQSRGVPEGECVQDMVIAAVRVLVVGRIEIGDIQQYPLSPQMLGEGLGIEARGGADLAVVMKDRRSEDCLATR